MKCLLSMIPLPYRHLLLFGKMLHPTLSLMAIAYESILVVQYAHACCNESMQFEHQLEVVLDAYFRLVFKSLVQITVIFIEEEREEII